MTVLDMMAELPRHCSLGVKKSSKGYQQYWSGYKLHLDVADGQIPITALLSAGRTVLLPSDDAAAYEQYVDRFVREFQPVGVREAELVQSVADTNWRLRRIPTLEFALYARGRSQFAEKFVAEPADAQGGLIELETYLFYEKQFRNLQLQETRLRRQRDKDLADLREAQQERHKQEARDIAAAAALYQVAKNLHRPFEPADHGFEFSIADIESYLEGASAAQAIRELAKVAA